MDNNNMVMVQEERKSLISVEQDKSRTYCSVVAETEEEKIMLYNALNGDADGKRVQDMINMEIEVKDVAFEIVDLIDDKTGEVEEAPRAILISPDGEVYNATSFGVLSSIQRCISVFGEPTWIPAKKFRVKQAKTKNGTMLKLDMVLPKKKK